MSRSSFPNLKDTLLKDLMNKISVNSFQITEPSLNNIFIRKVGEDITTGHIVEGEGK